MKQAFRSAKKQFNRDRKSWIELLIIVAISTGILFLLVAIEKIAALRTIFLFLKTNGLALLCFLIAWVILGTTSFGRYASTLGEDEEETAATATERLKNVRSWIIFYSLYILFCSFIALRGELNLLHCLTALVLVAIPVSFQYWFDSGVRRDMLRQNAEDVQEPPYNLCTDKKYFAGFLWLRWIALFCLITGIGVLVKLL